MRHLFATVLLLLLGASSLWAEYDPLATDKVSPEQKDFIVNDAARKR